MKDPEPLWIWPRAAYIHVPFCAHHCGYCDFAVAVGHDELVDAYLDALKQEFAGLAERQPLDTIYMGGGTPSYLTERQLEKLFIEIERSFQLSPEGEFSLEANPDSLSPAKLDLMKSHGVTRISLGAQSFHESTLRMLEREHDVAAVQTAVEGAQARELQLSLDLIFAVPGQTLGAWEDDLQSALALRPDHLSTYGLTFEKGTRLWHQKKQGLVRAVPENIELDFYSRTIDVLEEAGFEQYEISSFARPGRRCRHNATYWANHAHFGFGMGAARYVRGKRELNTRSLVEYIERLKTGRSPVVQTEELESWDRALETLAVQLRRVEGVPAATFQTQTGRALRDVSEPMATRLAELNLLEQNDDGIRLTRQGKYVADAVISEFMKAGPASARA
jgi:oxygen-independent coproporphyrinogen III oxidase